MNQKEALQGRRLLPLCRALPFAFFLTVLLLSSCEIRPTAIEYGKDMCSYCGMIAIDKRFGAEIINSKGKVLKFDCGECMFRYMKMDKGFKPAEYLVVSYENPGNLIDAEKAFYLSGGNINSPMGGKLAAFATQEAAEKFQKELKGDLILWAKVKGLNF